MGSRSSKIAKGVPLTVPSNLLENKLNERKRASEKGKKRDKTGRDSTSSTSTETKQKTSQNRKKIRNLFLGLKEDHSGDISRVLFTTFIFFSFPVRARAFARIYRTLCDRSALH
jgi:PAB1-binding protein PBP1